MEETANTETAIPVQSIEKIDPWHVVALSAVSFITMVGGIVGILLIEPMEKLASEPLPPIEEGARANPYDSVQIDAQAAYVLDVNTGKVLYAKNEEAQLPLASITKLMTALIVSNELGEEEIVTITSEDIAAEGDSGLTLGEEWNIRDLLKFTLVVSSNDGARALAGAVGAVTPSAKESPYDAFIDLMNVEAKEVGLAQTYFLNATGLDGSDILSGGYGSAKDVAHLLEHVLKHAPEVLEATGKEEEIYYSAQGIAHRAENTNEIVNEIPGFIAGKTGFTQLAGGNLVVALDVGVHHPIIIAVLGSTNEGRFKDVSTLAKAVIENLSFPSQSR